MVDLKQKFVKAYTMDQHEQANKLLHMPELGDTRPSTLMDNILALLGDHQPCFLFRQIFLERVPEEIRAHLVRADIQDCRDLASAADQLIGAQSPPASLCTVKRQSGKWRRSVNDSPSNPVCFFHRKFGSGAQKCQSPCSFSTANAMDIADQGNSNASR